MMRIYFIIIILLMVIAVFRVFKRPIKLQFFHYIIHDQPHMFAWHVKKFKTKQIVHYLKKSMWLICFELLGEMATINANHLS